MDFKERFLGDFEKIRREVFLGQTPKKGAHVRNRIRAALEGTIHGALIDKCRTSDRCSSVFCDECAGRRQNRLYASLKGRAERYGGESEVRRQMKFLTVVHSIVPILDHNNKNDIFEEIRDSVSSMKANIQKVTRKFSKSGIWLRGALHLELINTEFYALVDDLGFKSKSTKRITINHLTDHYGKAFLIHFHAVLDVGKSRSEEIKKFLEGIWTVQKSVRLEDLHRNHTWQTPDGVMGHKEMSIEDNLKNISAYCFNGGNKNLAYSDSYASVDEYSKREVKEAIVDFAVEVLADEMSGRLSYRDIDLLVAAYDAVAGISERGLSVSIY